MMGSKGSIRRTLTVGLVTTMLASIAACKSEQDEQREMANAAELAAAQAELKERERVRQEKERLLRAPTLFLEASDFQVYDKGIINDYRQLTKMTVLNKSKFPVRSIRGEVDWIGNDGQKRGSMPFTIKGSIPAGDTKSFSEAAGTLTNGTIQTSAKKVRVRFTHVEIVESP